MKKKFKFKQLLNEYNNTINEVEESNICLISHELLTEKEVERVIQKVKPYRC